jgi:hypothetical protein
VCNGAPAEEARHDREATQPPKTRKGSARSAASPKLRTRLGGVFAVFIVPYGYKGQMGLEEEASPDKWGGSTGATRKLAWRISMHLTGLSRAQQRWVGVPWWNSMVQPVSVRRQIELRFDRAP